MRSAFEQWVASNWTVMDQSGDEWSCLCPWHEDRSPSLRVNIDKGVYFCHGCGAKGKLAKLMDGRAVYTADDLTRLADKLNGMAAPPVVEELREYPERWITQFNHDKGDDYWYGERSLDNDVQHTWGLGYDARTDSATIALRDHEGRLLGVVRRRLDPAAKPKYLYPKGFKASENLFGSWAVPYGADLCFTEGPVDALTLWQLGFPAVALYGAHMSEQQHRIVTQLAPRRVLMFFDDDPAGHACSKQVAETLGGIYPMAAVKHYPGGVKDANGCDHNVLIGLHQMMVERACFKMPGQELA